MARTFIFVATAIMSVNSACAYLLLTHRRTVDLLTHVIITSVSLNASDSFSADYFSFSGLTAKNNFLSSFQIFASLAFLKFFLC